MMLHDTILSAMQRQKDLRLFIEIGVEYSKTEVQTFLSDPVLKRMPEVQELGKKHGLVPGGETFNG